MYDAQFVTLTKLLVASVILDTPAGKAASKVSLTSYTKFLKGFNMSRNKEQIRICFPFLAQHVNRIETLVDEVKASGKESLQTPNLQVEFIRTVDILNSIEDLSDKDEVAAQTATHAASVTSAGLDAAGRAGSATNSGVGTGEEEVGGYSLEAAEDGV